ncbi:MAG: alpha-D-ribose 1-methylphosphonate 5-phosphate C-P-lyase PhnJ, partial [Paraburkholderia sp.]|nr:alpha-D-ribose 1-methylphosphonate 5-phosphate C-P-lyase PhnJ [Paraburkholderia sp.]
GSRESFLDEMIVDDSGKRMFVCSDSDYCHERREDIDAHATNESGENA